MAIPHKCPVCYGRGTVSKPPHIPGDQLTWSSSTQATYDCHACNGTGVVWEPVDVVVEPVDQIDAHASG